MKLLSVMLSILMTVSLSSCAQKNPATDQQADKMKAKIKHPSEQELSKYSQATFAAGCFWCVEAVFESVNGVQEAVSGYACGQTKNPTYEEVGSGSTGHAESVTVYYDSSVVNYPTLLKVYFASEDPTQVNGQGPDHGTQYRSIIFDRNDKEKQEAMRYIDELNKSGKFDQPIAAEVTPFTVFWKAEDYHQNYIENHTDHPYV